MATIEEMRAAANAHAKEIEAVHWLAVTDLAARWGVSANTVRKIPRDRLGYLVLGIQRRYDPRDVERYEAEQKHGSESAA